MSFFKLPSKKMSCHPIHIRGFTLIELLVCITIVSIVSAVILVRNNSFNGAVLLRNQSYELALAIRQAQLLAVSGGGSATRQYGVFIDTSTSASRKQYIIFGDANNDQQFDQGEEIGQAGKLDSRFEIRGAFGNTTGTTQLSIMFRRPNFDGLFYNGTGGVLPGPAYVDVAQVGLSGNGSGDVRRVSVSSAGQVGVGIYP